MTTSQHLRTIATIWTDLQDALGERGTIGSFGLGLRSYLAQLEQYDAIPPVHHVQQLITTRDEHDRTQYACAHCDHVGPGHTHLTSEDRNPAQLGERPIPIRLRVYETIRCVEAALVECADQIAPSITVDPMKPPAPRRAAPARTRAERVAWADHARRIEQARADAADPRRWRYSGQRTAPYAALWLLARVERMRGPFRPLTEQHLRHIARVAAGAVARIEAVLDLADERRELTSEHPCPCGGTIEVYGGAGATPVARCKGCGAIWSERGVIAA